MAKKKTFNPKTKIVPAIRRIWFHSPLRREVMKRAKVDEYFRCEKCRGLQEKVHIDHINPCVPLTGWAGYDVFITNLFCDPSQLQVICEKCHSKKTQDEVKTRKENRAKNQPKKKTKKDEIISE
jgi:5-methylcytosine-specific restriction endonuclease McrA